MTVTSLTVTSLTVKSPLHDLQDRPWAGPPLAAERSLRLLTVR